MSQYFPKPYRNFGENVKVELYLSSYATKADLKRRISESSEIKNIIQTVSGLATTSALNAVENKIPYVSSLVKKTDYDAKISDI